MRLHKSNSNTIRLQRGAVAAAVGFLESFGDPEGNVVMLPRGRHARVAMSSGDVYADYQLEVSKPLKQRFSIPIRRLRNLVETSYQPDEIDLQPLPNSNFASANNQRSVPFTRLPESLETSWSNVLATMTWDSRLSDHLPLVGVAPINGHSQIGLDCIQIDQRSQRQSIAACSNHLLVGMCERTSRQMDEPTTILVQRKHLPILQKTCESKSRVKVEVGLQHFRVTCGRRTATFPRPNAHFPSWHEWFAKAKRIATGRLNHVLFIEADARQIAEKYSQSNDEMVHIQQCAGAEDATDAYRVWVRRRDLVSVAFHWPRKRFRMIVQGRQQPLIIAPVAAPDNLFAILMPAAR